MTSATAARVLFVQALNDKARMVHHYAPPFGAAAWILRG
jgi:hypothetical protein